MILLRDTSYFGDMTISFMIGQDVEFIPNSKWLNLLCGKNTQERTHFIILIFGVIVLSNMVPSSNWTGSKPLKLEMWVRSPLESPLGNGYYLDVKLYPPGANIVVEYH